MAQERATALPSITVHQAEPRGGAASGGVGAGPAAPSERCVEGGGSSQAIDCITAKLKQQVDRTNPNATVAPIDARSQDIKIGIANVPAVPQQYGKNFGVSVIPYRPAPPIYSSPVVRAKEQ
jgi:hypothetical protein